LVVSLPNLRVFSAEADSFQQGMKPKKAALGLPSSGCDQGKPVASGLADLADQLSGWTTRLRASGGC
jgi:hypothetical protein